MKTKLMSTFSISPCSFREAGGTYVMVRFPAADRRPGCSLRFYFTPDGWDRARTESHHLRNGGKTATEVRMRMLGEHEAAIFERAKKKLLNLSNIDQYAKHNLSFYKEENQRIIPVTESEKADPNYTPIIVFSFGPTHLLMFKPYSTEEQYFKISKFYFPYRTIQTPGLLPIAGAEKKGDWQNAGYLRPEDYTPLDPEDAYVREKIRRTLEELL